ncbi:MAG TPA: tol-pal system protein YbgF [Polyangiaceae bacterium]|nr:tol-pal system protein YbgF [Polyangiaceae bacterium]
MRLRALLTLPVFALLANFGCGRSAEERQLDSMRDEIDKIREGRDRADHVAIARDAPEPSLVLPGAYTSAEPVGQPPPVLQIGSGGQSMVDDGAETADPQDTTPRPTIRVFGSARGGRSPRRGEDQIEESAPEESSGASGSPLRAGGTSAASPARGREGDTLDPEAKRAYDAALSLVNTKRCDQALDAFAAFLVRWPDHPYADNAMYWRGECYFARGDYVHASEQFDGALKRFPAGNKTPDALLKLGVSRDKLGQAMKAKECFDRLVRQYPESDAAHHIPAVAVRAASPAAPAPEEGR